ncbi:MAG TPA: ribose-phosphate diphosphokinase [Candidatus Bathyarchaeia archaeon]|nr:ribose-phosphate diphosphokinase [Candidatus Bathyarchaeia archaeon]
MLILGGSASQPLAEKVAKELGQEAGQLEVKRFPDGEKYLRIHDNVKDQDVVAIQSLYRTPDENIFELLLLTDTLRDLGARSISAVVPYFAYTRQDSRFYPGEAVSCASVARLIESAGATTFLTIDCHLHRLGDVAKVFKIPARNLTAMHELGKYAREHFKPKNPMVIGPDEEADQWAAVVAKELDAEHTVFRKVRVRKEGMTSSKVEVDAGEINLKGRDVVFADDIISTGGTIAEAAKACKKGGAKRIFVVCTHPVLAEGALKRIKTAGVLRVIGTDTYPGPTSKVSVAPVIAAALKS